MNQVITALFVALFVVGGVKSLTASQRGIQRAHATLYSQQDDAPLYPGDNIPVDYERSGGVKGYRHGDHCIDMRVF